MFLVITKEYPRFGFCYTFKNISLLYNYVSAALRGISEITEAFVTV